MNELRREPLLGRWVAVLSESEGPASYIREYPIPEASSCNLCVGERQDIPVFFQSGDAGNGRPLLKVVPGQSPIFSLDGDLGRRGVGMYDRMNSIGTYEVVIEAPDHDKRPEDMGTEQMVRILDAYITRMKELEKDPRIRYILIHKNSGLPSGDTCGHSHSLITATPVIPKRIKEELDGAKHYFEYKERCIFCDIIREEERLGERIIARTDHFITFAPYAPRFPFEFWILPLRHHCSFPEINDEEKADLGSLLGTMLRKLRRLLNEPPYNYIIHTAPIRIPRRNQWHTLGEDFHWHIEVMPRVRRLSGFELGSGMYTLSTSPEDAAKYLQEVSDGD